MPTNFPTSVDNFTNPTANDSLNLPSHSTQHANANDAIEAVEDYLLNGAGRSGLLLVKTQTIGTGVSSVVVSDAFSSTYENYKILVSNGASSANPEILFSFNGGANQYNGGFIFKPFSSTSITGTILSSGSSWSVGFSQPSGISVNVEIGSPFLTKVSTYCISSSVNNTGGSVIFANGFYNDTTSFTGFTLTTSTGTLTGGTIAVYGYRK
jgi:hypothetical protein